MEQDEAQRRGRVRRAVEVPLPDAACRGRLIGLYGRGLALRVGDSDALVRRTEGVSAAFIKEWLRRAVLFAADEGAAGDGGDLTKSLLGAQRAAA